MTTSRIIEATAAACYARGVHPLDVAAALIIVITEVVLEAEHDPRAHVLARRICGAMLDAQWTMPTERRDE